MGELHGCGEEQIQVSASKCAQKWMRERIVAGRGTMDVAVVSVAEWVKSDMGEKGRTVCGAARAGCRRPAIDPHGCSEEERPIRVQIVQPLVPTYRVPLFRGLAQCRGLYVSVDASRTVPGLPDIASVEMGTEYVNLDHPCVGIIRNRVLWQRGLHLDAHMGRGDVVVLSGNLRFVSNMPLMIRAKIRRVAIVWWAHGFSKRRTLFKDIINRLLSWIVDVRLLYTDEEVEEYRRLGISNDKLFALNNAIDHRSIHECMAAWKGEELKRFQEREHLSGKRLLLFCGRRVGKVALSDVFEAMALLKESGNEYTLAIIGPDHSGGYLGDRARQAGVGHSVRWLGPMFDPYAMTPWFMSAQCFVFPGAIGLGLLHAFSYGLPVIVPRCVHGPEAAALRPGVNGLTYCQGNVVDLAEKINAIAMNSEYRRTMSEEARMTVEMHYNLDMMIERFVAAIRAAAARGCHEVT